MTVPVKKSGLPVAKSSTIPLQAAGLNLMQILAPALGGYMIDWTSAAWVYVFIAALAAMSVLMLFFVKSLSPEELAADRAGGPSGGRAPARDPVGDDHGPRSRGSTIEDLSGGVEYLRRDRTVLSILSFSFLATLLGMPIRLLLPGYAAAVFGDEGSTLGLLQMGTEIPPPRLNRPSKTHGTVAYPLGLLACRQ